MGRGKAKPGPITRLCAFALASVLFVGIGSAANAAADRAQLIHEMDRFVVAMMAPADTPPDLAANVKVTENGAAIRLADSQLHRLKTLSYRQTFADPSDYEVGFYGAGDEGDRLAIFSVRLHITGGKVTEVETVVAHAGEASIFAADKMTAPAPEYAAMVSPADQVSRAHMIAAANAYFDGIEKADGADVPAAPTCNRVENGVQTTNRTPGAGGCKEGLKRLTYIKHVRDRRFPIVDPQRGLVWGLVVFDIPAGTMTVTENGQTVERPRPARSILINELFKISGGQIQDIAVVMRNVALGAQSGWAP